MRDITKHKIELHTLYREFEIKIEFHPPTHTPKNERGMFYVHSLIEEWQHLALVLSSATQDAS